MKSYQFSLETVTRIRTLQERIAREQLSQVQRELRRSQENYRIANDELNNCEAATAPCASDDVKWQHAQNARRGERVQLTAERLLAAATRRDEARQRWREARQRAEVLTRFDATARAQWRVAARREEVLETDDVTNSRRSWEGRR